MPETTRSGANAPAAHEPILKREQAEELAAAFVRFYEILARLRAPDGCPWDREQTPLSMRSDLIEETFEAVEAITEGDAPHIKEELGDVLLNACMIAYMHEQRGVFSMADLLAEVGDKLVRRHPHVFAESAGRSQAQGKAQNSEQVLAQWDRIKRNVEGRAGKSALDEVSAGLPPLIRAAKLQKKAAKKGFDWSGMDDVYAKVLEELAEVKQAVALCAEAASAAGEVGEADAKGQVHGGEAARGRNSYSRTSDEVVASACASSESAKRRGLGESAANAEALDELAGVNAAGVRGQGEEVASRQISCGGTSDAIESECVSGESVLNAAQSNLEEEIGDLLFSVVNVARKLKIDPDIALDRTNRKFCKRFAHVEGRMSAASLPMDSEHLSDMERFWEEAKTATNSF